MTRRGAILFEMLVSIAIFVATGLLTMSIVNNTFAALSRTHRLQLALDLARSRLAELEAGLISPADLEDGTIDAIGSLTLADEARVIDPTDDPGRWLVEVATERTAYDGLTLVELTVYVGPEEDAPSVTLRQLVRLHPPPAAEYEQDDLIVDLPQREGDGR